MKRSAAKTSRTLALVASILFGSTALADAVAVPAGIQANLTAKLLAFDRALAARAGGTVRVLILIDTAEGQSQKIANEFSAALKSRPSIAGLPIAATIAPFKDAGAIAAQVRKERLSAVYLSSGLGRFAERIADALKGTDVMTIAAEPAAVIRGISVGFDLVSGQPKILVNLKQAKQQNIQLPASVLALAVIQGG